MQFKFFSATDEDALRPIRDVERQVNVWLAEHPQVWVSNWKLQLAMRAEGEETTCLTTCVMVLEIDEMKSIG